MFLSTLESRMHIIYLGLITEVSLLFIRVINNKTSVCCLLLAIRGQISGADPGIFKGRRGGGGLLSNSFEPVLH